MTNNSIKPHPHAGVMMTGDNGPDGPKAFYILIDARAGREDEVGLYRLLSMA